ncbi:MAG TPA: hypothetical protein VI980_12530 [Acidimicrobiia bacterium]|nr:hypothetical protein [Acidimicrobiia bacterium]
MSIEWIVIRGSGVAAFALLSGATIWGLLVSSKLLGRIVKAKPLTWFHESLGIGAMVATLVHIVVLSVHDFLDFTWAEILVPGTSDWRPLPIAFGVVSLYTLGVVIASFYVKRFIGQKLWRSIHFASFGLFISALLHGMLAGTDTGSPLMLGLYAGSAIVVFALVAQRLTPDTAADSVTPQEVNARSVAGSS